MVGGPTNDNFQSTGRDWSADTDIFVGREGRDSFWADPGDDLFDGGPGRDHLSYFDSPSGVDVDLAAGTATGDGSDVFLSIADVAGSRHDDIIRGNQLRNDIFSAPGNDIVYGLGGVTNSLTPAEVTESRVAGVTRSTLHRVLLQLEPRTDELSDGSSPSRHSDRRPRQRPNRVGTG